MIFRILVAPHVIRISPRAQEWMRKQKRQVEKK